MLERSSLTPSDTGILARAREARAISSRAKWARWLAAAILLAGMLDSVSTELALRGAGAREANPLVRALQEALGVYWILPKMAIHAVLAWMSVWYPNRPTLIALSVVTFLAFLASANNFAIYILAVTR